MKNRIYTLIILIIPLLVSCKHKDLCYDDHLKRDDIRVVIHWEDGAAKPSNGMMVNLFALGQSPRYGMAHLGVNGGTVKLLMGSSYYGLCYDYYANNIHFRGEDVLDDIEAFSPALIRATYQRSYPDETTVSEPACPFWVDRVSYFPVDGNDLHFYPESATEEFTFEIRNVKGAQYITSTRGGISGMSGSRYLSDGALTASQVTVLFDAAKDGANNKIVGSFRTFGALITRTNRFSIEILYPSTEGGIIEAFWDVTDQVRSARHIPGTPDIIIDNPDWDDGGGGYIPEIVPDPEGSGSGFQADVDDWEDVYVPLPM